MVFKQYNSLLYTIYPAKKICILNKLYRFEEIQSLSILHKTKQHLRSKKLIMWYCWYLWYDFFLESRVHLFKFKTPGSYRILYICRFKNAIMIVIRVSDLKWRFLTLVPKLMLQFIVLSIINLITSIILCFSVDYWFIREHYIW
jgi:hypothetical protein